MLTEHIAVMDLMALADALLLPQDDLALATVLKSPLFGLDDDALFALAWDRKGTLRAALRAQTAGSCAGRVSRSTIWRTRRGAIRRLRFTRMAARRPAGPAQSFSRRLGPRGQRRAR